MRINFFSEKFKAKKISSRLQRDVNNILLDDKDLPKPTSIPDSPAMVNYFFNV